MHICDSNVDSEGFWMCHGTLGLIKINNLNLGNPIYTVAWNKFTCIRTFYFLDTWSNRWRDNVCFVRYGLYWCGIQKKVEIFVLFIFHKLIFFPLLSLRTFKKFSNLIWGYRFLWETKVNMLNHRSNLIKSRPNTFNIFPMVSLPSE